MRPQIRITVPHVSRARQQHPLNPRVSAVIQLAKRAQAALLTYIALRATRTQLKTRTVTVYVTQVSENHSSMVVWQHVHLDMKNRWI